MSIAEGSVGTTTGVGVVVVGVVGCLGTTGGGVVFNSLEGGLPGGALDGGAEEEEEEEGVSFSPAIPGISSSRASSLPSTEYSGINSSISCSNFLTLNRVPNTLVTSAGGLVLVSNLRSVETVLLLKR